MKFEYKTIEPKMVKSAFKGNRIDVEDLNIHLKYLGMEGWELVTGLGTHTAGSTHNSVLIFKRPLAED